MKMTAALLAVLVFAGPAVPYFKYQRPVQVTGSGQHYFTVDEALW
jgi:hypothetical protein